MDAPLAKGRPPHKRSRWLTKVQSMHWGEGGQVSKRGLRYVKLSWHKSLLKAPICQLLSHLIKGHKGTMGGEGAKIFFIPQVCLRYGLIYRMFLNIDTYLIILLLSWYNVTVGAIINYLNRILMIFDTPPFHNISLVYVTSLTFGWPPLPLACQRSLWNMDAP